MNKDKIPRIAIFIVLIAIFAGGGFYFGYDAGYEKGIKNPKRVIIEEVKNINKGKPEEIDFALFWEVWQTVKDKFIGIDKIENQDLVYGAISGMVRALRDQNSAFFPPSDAKKFTEDISGEFSGIGAEIGIRNDQLVIVAPLKDSPAERAGLRSGDKILQVDGNSTVNLSVEEAVKIIRGERNTVVKLNIMRDGWTGPKEFSIKRDIIRLPTIDFEMKGDIAYIHLYNFFEKAPFEFYNTAIKAAINNPKGIVIDLRDNPGGFLEIANTITGWFLEAGKVVVREQFKSEPEHTFKSQGPGLFKDTPVVILVNQGSASASEIFTGALRDNRGVKVVGKKTFGKGTVQELVEMRENSLLKITIANWLTPNGNVIEKNGIAPDYEVDLTDEDINNKRDPQLDKAIEVLRSQIEKEQALIPNFIFGENFIGY